MKTWKKVLFVTASKQLENWCSCAWDNNHIKCNVQYDYFEATEPWIKTPITNGEYGALVGQGSSWPPDWMSLWYFRGCHDSGDPVGDFFYTCVLESGNIKLDVKTCPSSIDEHKRGKTLVQGTNYSFYLLKSFFSKVSNILI